MPIAEAVSVLLMSERMGNPALDQFVHELQSTVLPVLILTAIGVVLIGLPLYWLRLKLERKLIKMVRSARAGQSGQFPHCPVCNSVMIKRTARRGANAGSQFWGCPNYPKCRGTREM